MSNEIDRARDDTRAFLDARPFPDVRPAVMRRIEEQLVLPRRPGILKRIGILLWAPRDISIRPAFALVGIGAALIFSLVFYQGEAPPVTGQVARDGVGVAPYVFVRFRLEAAASRVQLAGSFTNWEPRYELRQYAPGIWTITVPLTEGVHDYAFVVNGREWVPDPYAPQIDDGFGGTNSRLKLLSPDTPQL